MTNITEAADKAEAIYAAHEEGAAADAGFDGGEFSGPAHDKMAEKEVRAMCEAEGVSFDDVQDELSRRSNEFWGKKMDEQWPEGSEPGQNPGGAR